MSEKLTMLDWPTRDFQFTLPIRYHLTPNSGNGVVICLHGYQDHALSMLRRIGWWNTNLPFQILALNAPFPVPLWTTNGFKEAYSWYFRDTSVKVMLAQPTATAQTLKRLIVELNLEEIPKVLFGFSQGGYMAPYLAAQLKNVKGIIGLGCSYPSEGYSSCPPLVVHAIHGDQDERVSIENAKADFEQITQFDHRGEFHEIPGLKHKVEYSVEPLIRQLALKSLTKGSK